MQIKMETVSFGRWKAELWEGDEKVLQVVSPQPGCALKDCLNAYCLQYNDVPTTSIELDITSWE